MRTSRFTGDVTKIRSLYGGRDWIIGRDVQNAHTATVCRSKELLLEYGSARNARLSLQEKHILLQKKRRRCSKW